MIGKYNEFDDSVRDIPNPIIGQMKYTIDTEKMPSSKRADIVEEIYNQIRILHRVDPLYTCYSLWSPEDPYSISKSTFFDDGINYPDEDSVYAVIWELDKSYITLETSKFWTLLTFHSYIIE